MQRTRFRLTRIVLWLACAAVIGLAGCAPTQVRTDYNPQWEFGHRQTYVWLPYKAEAGTASDIEFAIGAIEMQEAIDRELQEHGYQKVSEEAADFRVAFHIVGADDVVLHDEEGHRPRYRLTDREWDVYARGFERGTVVIDIIHDIEDAVVWRGWLDGVLADIEIEDPQAEANLIASDILSEFPPNDPPEEGIDSYIADTPGADPTGADAIDVEHLEQPDKTIGHEPGDGK